MLSVVYCEDSSNATLARQHSYDAHIHYLGTIKDRICFVGPLAIADGARGQGDGNLVGSLFVMGEPPSAAHELLQADPYVHSGVWKSFSVFQAVDAFGPWAASEAPRSADHLYVSLARLGEGPVVDREVALFGAKLQSKKIQQVGASAPYWSAMAILTAASLPEARSNVLKNALAEDRRIETWAVPICLGTWIQTHKTIE